MAVVEEEGWLRAEEGGVTTATKRGGGHAERFVEHEIRREKRRPKLVRTFCRARGGCPKRGTKTEQKGGSNLLVLLLLLLWKTEGERTLLVANAARWRTG